MKSNSIFVAVAATVFCLSPTPLFADIIYDIDLTLGDVSVTGSVTTTGVGVISADTTPGGGSLLQAFSLTFTDLNGAVATTTVTDTSVGAGITIAGATLEATPTNLIVNTPTVLFQNNTFTLGTPFTSDPTNDFGSIGTTALVLPAFQVLEFEAIFQPANTGTGASGIGTFANSITIGSVSTVPEPSSFALLGMGFAAFIFRPRGRRVQQNAKYPGGAPELPSDRNLKSTSLAATR